jgi:hypothetical protein
MNSNRVVGIYDPLLPASLLGPFGMPTNSLHSMSGSSYLRFYSDRALQLVRYRAKLNDLSTVFSTAFDIRLTRCGVGDSSWLDECKSGRPTWRITANVSRVGPASGRSKYEPLDCV